MADPDKIKGLFRRANQAAAEQDPDVRKKILGSLVIRMDQDPALREALRRNPAQVVEREAAAANLTATPEDVKDVSEKAQKLVSRVVPGADPDKVTKMVFDTVSDIEKSFRLTLQLTRVLFGTGLLMIVASFVVVAVIRDKQTAAIFGVGGVLSLLLSTVMNTLDRVRNAAANLVQIQMAYLAYYKIQDLLGPAADQTSKEDAIALAGELTENVGKIMASLQGILQEAKEPGKSLRPRVRKPAEAHKATQAGGHKPDPPA